MTETEAPKNAETKQKFRKSFSEYRQTQMKFDPATHQRIEDIRDYYGLATANAAVAVAIRICHDGIQNTQKPRGKAGKTEAGK